MSDNKPCISIKRLTEIQEIFDLFENQDNPGFVSISELNLAIKCIGHTPTEEEMDLLAKQEGKGTLTHACLHMHFPGQLPSQIKNAYDDLGKATIHFVTFTVRKFPIEIKNTSFKMQLKIEFCV